METQGGRIARRKQFLLQPMDEFEAIEQMDLLGHEQFFVYLDANSGQVNVLYRRRDDTFGLIETMNG
jgi:putative sigma-54 modulation protein